MSTGQKILREQSSDASLKPLVPPLPTEPSDEFDRRLHTTPLFINTTESCIPPEDWSGLDLASVRTILADLQDTSVEDTTYLSSTLSAETVARIVQMYGVTFEQFSDGLSAFRNEEQRRSEIALYREQIRLSVVGNSTIAPLQLNDPERLFELKFAAFTNSLVGLLDTTAKVLRRDPNKASAITNKEGVLTALFEDVDGKTTSIPTPFFTKENVQGWEMKPRDFVVAPFVAFLRGVAHGVEILFPSDGVFGNDRAVSMTYSSPCFRSERSPNFQRIVRAADSLDATVMAEFVSNEERFKQERVYDLVLTFRHNAFLQSTDT